MFPNETSASSRNTKGAPKTTSSNGGGGVDGVSCTCQDCGCCDGSCRNCSCSNCQRRRQRVERRT